MESVCKICSRYKKSECTSKNCAACTADFIDAPGCIGITSCRRSMTVSLQACPGFIQLIGEWNQKANIIRG